MFAVMVCCHECQFHIAHSFVQGEKLQEALISKEASTCILSSDVSLNRHRNVEIPSSSGYRPIAKVMCHCSCVWSLSPWKNNHKEESRHVYQLLVGDNRLMNTVQIQSLPFNCMKQVSHLIRKWLKPQTSCSDPSIHCVARPSLLSRHDFGSLLNTTLARLQSTIRQTPFALECTMEELKRMEKSQTGFQIRCPFALRCAAWISW